MLALLVKRFCRNKNGNVMLIFALALVPIISAIGVAVDLAILRQAKTDARFSLDAALLAAALEAQKAKTASDVKYRTVGENTFAASYISDPAKSFGSYSGLSFDRPTKSNGTPDNTITGEVKVQTSTYFMKVINKSSLTAIIKGAAKIKIKNPIEVAVVVDVTGSIGYQGYRGFLEEAGKTFIDTIFKGSTELPDDNYVGVVPYSQSVNIGNLVKNVSTNYLGTDNVLRPTANADYIAYPPSDRQIVLERRSDRNGNDAAPAGRNRYGVTDDIALHVDDRLQPARQIVPPTNKKKPLWDVFDNITVKGRTAGHVGMQWGLNMLSPDWATVWGRKISPYATSGNGGTSGNGASARKFLVIMTDGEFDYSPGRSSGRGGHGFAVNELNDRFLKKCTFAKNNGIIVYAVGLALTPKAKKLMKQCATQGYYVNIPKGNKTVVGNKLIKTFATIAAQISDNFRLSS